MKWSKYYAQAIHEELISLSKSSQADYHLKKEQYRNLDRKDRLKNSKPATPPRRMLFIPANSSASAFIQALADNYFKGIIFETEADTLANTFKQDWGNFSDVLRKAFHHENTSLFRRKENEFIEIEDPHLAIILSGTPRQVHHMMPDVENGLFSRFLFYAFRSHGEFRNPFVSPGSTDFIRFFRQQGERIRNMHHKMKTLKEPILFSLTPEQGVQLTREFNKKLRKSRLLVGDEFEANTKRLGLITFRMAMILSTLQFIDKENIPEHLICRDIDFTTALSLASTLEKHSMAVYNNFRAKPLSGVRQKFFEALPPSFNRKTYLDTAESLGIHEKHADKLIYEMKDFVTLKHLNHKYFKIHSS